MYSGADVTPAEWQALEEYVERKMMRKGILESLGLAAKRSARAS